MTVVLLPGTVLILDALIIDLVDGLPDDFRSI